jgi:hypothetical protein
MHAVICRAWGEPEGAVVEDVAPPTLAPHVPGRRHAPKLRSAFAAKRT